MELSHSLRVRLELKALREQVVRMAEEHRSKKAAEFDVAYFAASMRLSNLEALNERAGLLGDTDGAGRSLAGSHQTGRSQPVVGGG